MDIQLEKNTGTEALIKVKLKVDDYQPIVKEKLKDYAKKATLKGFRPGKVPLSLIEKMYGKAVRAEEINKILVDAVMKYIKDNDIKIIGDPIPNNDKVKEIDWDSQTEFDFEYAIGLVDDFKYDLNFKITKYAIKLDKKEIDRTIEELKQRYGKMTNPEVSEEGDSLFGTLAQKSSEFSKDCLIEIGKVAKKFQKKFIGLKKGDVIKFDIQKLFKESADLEAVTGMTDDEVKNLQGEFEFTVKNVNRVIPAEMNQEFFDKIFGEGEVKSEKEFIEKYTEIYKKNYDDESEYLLSHQIQEKLIKDTKIELPEGFYKKWILATNEQLTEEELEKDFEHYLRDLKWTLIKNKIAADHDIKVEYQEVLDKTKNLYKAQFGNIDFSGELEKNLEVMANNYLQENNGENYYQIYNQLRTEKIMDVIKQNANITVKEVTRDEFSKKAEK